MRLLMTLGLAALLQGSAAGPEKTAVMATVQQFVDAFNKGDTKTAAGACAEQTSIIDEFPPYDWHGVGACSNWMKDYDAFAKKNGITDAILTLGSPKHLEITSDRAYVVVPADFAYKEKGKPAKQAGSTFTLTLRKGAAGWRITAWAWGKN